MWWLVWLLLVLAALGTGALLALRLWRQAKALGRDLGAAAELTARLEVDDPVPAAVHAPGALAEPATLATARETRARITDERVRLRRARLDRARSRWRAHGLTD
jgi:hypothetical protein